MPKHTLLRELVHTDLNGWTEDKLTQLSGVELTTCCQIIGVPFSGTKAAKVKRLTTLAALLYRFRRYDRNRDRELTPEQVMHFAKGFNGAELRDLCKQAGCYAGSTKYARAVALLAWRRACLSRGERFVSQVRNSRVSNQKQLWLF